MKHIRLYLFVLFTACSMFMVCPFAHAESMPSEVVSYLDEFFNYSDSTFNGYLNQIESECPYMFAAKTSSSWSVYFSSNEDMFIPFWRDTSAWFISDETPANCSIWLGTTAESLDTCYSINMSSGRYVEITKWTPVSIASTYDRVHFYSCSRTLIYSTSNFNYFDVPLASLSNSGRYGDWTFYAKYNSSSTYYFSNLYESNIEVATYTDDDRLKFAIVDNIYGGKNLMTDIRQFINDFPIQDTSHSSVLLYPESITLSYSVDNVEKTLTLSSSNSSIKSKYIFETDLSNFDFDESAQNVIITKCDFTISGNTQGGQTETENYKISCDYYISRFIQPIEQGSNPYESILNGDQTSQETKDSLQYLVTFREGYGLDFDEFSDLSFPDYYTYADVYLYNNSAAYNYLIDNILSVNAVAYIIQSLANSEEDVITQIGLFLDDSNYGEYYDVIVFDWIQETSSTYTHTYFYFETVSGRVKATTQFLQVMQDDLNKVKINTAAAFTAIDNFESESIQFFNAKLGLDADLLGWVKTIDNSINNLDFPVYDDSNIVSLLGQIKDLLSSPANEIDTPQECIQLYEAHPNYFNELWGTPTPALRSASVTPSPNNPFISSDYVRADLVPAWWEGKTLTMIYILKNDGETSRFYNDILNGLFDSYENLIESDNSFNTFIDSLFKTGYDYTDSFYGHMFDLDYNPEAWDGGFAENE